MGDQYRTTTIYLDTEARDVFHRRGSYGRSKYRIRRYGASDTTFLERKRRTSQLLNKRRATVATDDLPALFDTATGSSSLRWFLDRVTHRRLAPVCQVSYRRHALVGATDYGPIRLTFDDDLSVQPNASMAFAPDGGVPVLVGLVIVEMKFCVNMPAVFRTIVEEFNLVPAPISKYRTAVDELTSSAGMNEHGVATETTVDSAYLPAARRLALSDLAGA